MKTEVGTKKTLYIAGPISGMPEENLKNFYDAHAALVNQGYNVFNPFDVVKNANVSREKCESDAAFWHECMSACLPFVGLADGIYLLKGWETSRGARIELKHALDRFKQVVVSDKF